MHVCKLNSLNTNLIAISDQQGVCVCVCVCVCVFEGEMGMFIGGFLRTKIVHLKAMKIISVDMCYFLWCVFGVESSYSPNSIPFGVVISFCILI